MIVIFKSITLIIIVPIVTIVVLLMIVTMTRTLKMENDREWQLKQLRKTFEAIEKQMKLTRI